MPPPRTRAASHARGLYRPIENVLDVDGMQWAICTDSLIYHAVHRGTQTTLKRVQGGPKSEATKSWPYFCQILTDLYICFHWKLPW